MCGITGLWDFNQGAIEADLSSMTGSLVHRGPDDSGFFTSAGPGSRLRPQAALDHRPLAARQAADARRRSHDHNHLQRRDL